MTWLIGLIVVAIVGAMAWRAYGWIARERAIAAASMAESDRELAALFAVPAAEAFERAEARIRAGNLSEPWPAEATIPHDIEAVLATLHPALASLLRRHRLIRVEGDLEIGAECLRDRRERPDGALPIGRKPADRDWALCTRAGDPVVFELHERDTLATYPTLAHFLLLMTDD